MDGIEFLLNERISDEKLGQYESAYRERALLRTSKAESLSDDDANVYFQYALALVQSPYKSDWKRGRNLFQDLYTLNPKDEQAKRDYLFYCSIAEIKLHNYKEALKFANSILYIEPFNSQAQALKSYVENKQNKDMIVGSAVVGGVAVLGAALLGGLLAKK